MKIKLTKTFTCVIDTDEERKRIKENFKGKNLQKLNEFLDAIEALDLKKAEALLDTKWWNGYDKDAHCSRLEFIGFLFNSERVPNGFYSYASYSDLVYAVLSSPQNYKLKRIK